VCASTYGWARVDAVDGAHAIPVGPAAFVAVAERLLDPDPCRERLRLERFEPR